MQWTRAEIFRADADPAVIEHRIEAALEYGSDTAATPAAQRAVRQHAGLDHRTAAESPGHAKDAGNGVA